MPSTFSALNFHAFVLPILVMAPAAHAQSAPDSAAVARGESFSGVDDASVTEFAPNTNYGSEPNLVIGDVSGDAWLSYVQFDVSAIPSGATINEVTIRFLRGCSSAAGGALALDVQRIDEAWDESTVTWSSRPDTTDLPIGYAIGPCTAGTSVVDLEDSDGAIVDWLQSIVDGDTENHGLCFGGLTASSYHVYSSAEGSQSPVLFVDYDVVPPTPAITDARTFGFVDSDGDGFASQFTLEVDIQSVARGGELFLRYFQRVGASDRLIAESDPFSISESGLFTHSQKINVTEHLGLDTARDGFPFRAKLYDAASSNQIDERTEADDSDLANIPIEPGSDILDYEDRLPNGKWTIIIHGLTNEDYGVLTDHINYNSPCDPNYLWRMADKIRKESSLDGTGMTSNVLIRRHDAAFGLIGDEGGAPLGANVADPNHHSVLLVDWTQISNFVIPELFPAEWDWAGFLPPEGAQGKDGYAEATADAVFAMLQRLGIATDIHAVIGYSRGAVVTSELAQRLILHEQSSAPTQVIYLDGEGGLTDNPLVTAYEDKYFYAWRNVPGLVTDNYYQSFFDDTPLNPLGGIPRSGTRGFDTDFSFNAPLRNYTHSDFREYFITGGVFGGCGLISGDPHGVSGLLVIDQRLQTIDTPEFATGVGEDPLTLDAPNSDEVFNGNFEATGSVGEIPSTAGWWFHGGTPFNGAVDNLGTVESDFESLDDRFALRLNAGQQRTHNWCARPATANSVVFSAKSPSSNLGNVSINVYWIEDANQPGLLLGTVVVPPGDEFTASVNAFPSESSSVGLIRFEAESHGVRGLDSVLLDDIRWAEQEVCETDLTGDSAVTAADIAELLSYWGPTASIADLDSDGDVDALDLATLLSYWGPCN